MPTLVINSSYRLIVTKHEYSVKAKLLLIRYSSPEGEGGNAIYSLIVICSYLFHCSQQVMLCDDPIVFVSLVDKHCMVFIE